jgi:hypothetical protein
MPLPGGASDKYGKRYENLWTVLNMLYILKEEADIIWIEPPKEHQDGFEFQIEKKGFTEYHQVKRQNIDGKWSIGQLKGKILPDFWSKLENEKNKCVFVSMYSAPEMVELIDRASKSENLDQFINSFLSTNKMYQKKFENLCENLKEPSPNEDKKNEDIQYRVYNILKSERITFRIIDEELLEDQVYSIITSLINGKEQEICEALGTLALKNIHKKLKLIDIWTYLERRGFSSKNLAQNSYRYTSITEQNKRYLTQLKDAIVLKEIIPQKKAELIIEKINTDQENKGILITGEAGIGKSNVILQITVNSRSNSSTSFHLIAPPENRCI